MMLHNGGILTVDNAIAIDPECCCEEVIPPSVGCCPNVLVGGTGVIVRATITDFNAPGCGFTLNDFIDLTEAIEPEIWVSEPDTLAPSWDGLRLACGADDQLVLEWDALTGCPANPNRTWDIQPDGTCNNAESFNIVFRYTISETVPPSPCPCESGWIEVTLTIP